MTTIADKLRAAIKNSRLTIYAIAQGSGVSQSVVHRFADGERDITLSTASKLAAYLKLDLAPKRPRQSSARPRRG